MNEKELEQMIEATIQVSKMEGVLEATRKQCDMLVEACQRLQIKLDEQRERAAAAEAELNTMRQQLQVYNNL